MQTHTLVESSFSSPRLVQTFPFKNQELISSLANNFNTQFAAALSRHCHVAFAFLFRSFFFFVSGEKTLTA